MTGATSARRAYSAIYFFRNTPAPPGPGAGALGEQHRQHPGRYRR